MHSCINYYWIIFSQFTFYQLKQVGIGMATCCQQISTQKQILIDTQTCRYQKLEKLGI